MPVDRMPTREANIRMWRFLTQDTSGRRYKEGFRKKQKDNAGCVKDTSRKENESRYGCPVGQEDQDVSG